MHDCFIWHSPLVDKLCLTSRHNHSPGNDGVCTIFNFHALPWNTFIFPQSLPRFQLSEMLPCSWRQNQWLAGGAPFINFTPYQLLHLIPRFFFHESKTGDFRSLVGSVKRGDLIRNLRNFIWSSNILSIVLFVNCVISRNNIFLNREQLSLEQLISHSRI